MIKVVLIDDSFFIRKVLRQMLSADNEIEVVGEAANGEEGLERVVQLKPDVVCLDIIMPHGDGVSTMEAIIKNYPTPVILLSSLSSPLAEISRDAFKMGVIDVVQKPDSPEKIGQVRDELLGKIKAAARIDKNKLGLVYGTSIREDAVEARASFPRKVLAIGCSGSTSSSLIDLVKMLPGTLTAGVVVYQHLPAQLGDAFLERLQQAASLPCKFVEDGDFIMSGRILVSPPGKTVEVNKLQRSGVVQLIDETLQVKSGIDALFESIARAYRDGVIAIALSGLGTDGIEGLRAVKHKGGITLVHNEGEIPGPVTDEKLADYILPLSAMSREITYLT